MYGENQHTGEPNNLKAFVSMKSKGYTVKGEILVVFSLEACA
jgi:hypothetical protein